MNEKELSYYSLYLLRYLTGNRFPEADNPAFIEERANQASDTYEQARLEGYPADGAQELPMRYPNRKHPPLRNNCFSR